ncbi:MAG TPA: PDZ domain-containing protein [Kofleriaceae bacterium]|nr:PDZ domain-containing protein [Kofleriaceae bacterium]
MRGSRRLLLAIGVASCAAPSQPAARTPAKPPVASAEAAPWAGIVFVGNNPTIETPPSSAMRILYVVPGAPADRAGIRADDEIVSIGGVAVDAPKQFVDRLALTHVGATVAVRIVRRGEASSVAMRLEARPGAEALKRLYADCTRCLHVTIIHHPTIVSDADWTAFRDAGCNQWGNCSQAAFARRFGCATADVATGLGGLRPVTAMAHCYRPAGGSTLHGLYSVGGIRPFDVVLIASVGDRFEPITTRAEFVRAFAPVETPGEAMAFVLALTPGVTADDLAIPPYAIASKRIESPFAERTPGGFHVHLFALPGLGCGQKSIATADYFVASNGDIHQTATEDIYADPAWAGCSD